MQETFVKRYVIDRQEGQTVAWGSVFAGVVTFLALSILFSLIGAAIGLGGFHPQAAHPLDGVGMGLILWTILSLVLSLAAAGYVAGVTAARAGMIHGFLVWALGVISALVLTGGAVSGGFHVIGQVLGGAGSAIGTTADSLGDTVSSLSQEAFDAISKELDVNFDSDQVSDDVVTALEKSDIPELQPDYLQGQLDAVIDEIKTASKEIIVDGQDPQVVFERVTQDIEDRAQNIYDEIDEDDLRRILADNTELTPAEADQTIENLKEAYADASVQAQEKLEEAKTSLAELEEQAQVKVEEAKQAADDFSSASAKYAIYLFIGLVLAAIVAAYSGYAGSRAARQGLEVAE